MFNAIFGNVGYSDLLKEIRKNGENMFNTIFGNVGYSDLLKEIRKNGESNQFKIIDYVVPPYPSESKEDLSDLYEDVVKLMRYENTTNVKNDVNDLMNAYVTNTTKGRAENKELNALKEQNKILKRELALLKLRDTIDDLDVDDEFKVLIGEKINELQK